MKNLQVYADLLAGYLDRMRAAAPGGAFPADRVLFLEARFGLSRSALLLPKLRRALVHNRSDFPLDIIDRLMGEVNDDRIMMELDEEATWRLLSASMAPLEKLTELLGKMLTAEPGRLYRWQPPARKTGTLEAVRRHRDAILQAAAEYGVTNVRVFGSVARGDDGPNSDVDFLVDAPEDLDWRRLADLRFDIACIVGREVDLVAERQLLPPIRENALQSAVPL